MILHRHRRLFCAYNSEQPVRKLRGGNFGKSKGTRVRSNRVTQSTYQSAEPIEAGRRRSFGAWSIKRLPTCRTHHVCRCSQKNQLGAEGAVGKEKCQRSVTHLPAHADLIRGSSQKNCSCAARQVGEAEVVSEEGCISEFSSRSACSTAGSR